MRAMNKKITVTSNPTLKATIVRKFSYCHWSLSTSHLFVICPKSEISHRHHHKPQIQQNRSSPINNNMVLKCWNFPEKRKKIGLLFNQPEFERDTILLFEINHVFDLHHDYHITNSSCNKIDPSYFFPFQQQQHPQENRATDLMNIDVVHIRGNSTTCLCIQHFHESSLTIEARYEFTALLFG